MCRPGWTSNLNVSLMAPVSKAETTHHAGGEAILLPSATSAVGKHQYEVTVAPYCSKLLPYMMIFERAKAMS